MSDTGARSPDPRNAGRGGKLLRARIVPESLAGGAVGTIVLTTGLRVPQEVDLTRMDIPLLLGTLFTEDRDRASVIGYGAGGGGLLNVLLPRDPQANGRSTVLVTLALHLAYGAMVGGFAAGL